MKTIYALLAVLILVTACAPAAKPDAGAVQTAVAQTMAAQQPTATPIPPTATTKPTQAIPPTATPVPPTATPVVDLAGKEYSWNHLASQESGKVKIDIARIVIGDKAWIESVTGNDFTNGGAVDIYNDKPVVAEIIFKVTNNSDKPINVYTDQGKLVVGSEQIDLLDYAMYGEFGDDFSGEIFPGVTAIGGMWIGIKRSALEDIKKMQIFIDGPSDNNLNTLGPDYKFDIDLSERKNEPLPDDLK